jgi:hypothetical protein
LRSFEITALDGVNDPYATEIEAQLVEITS